MMSLRKSLHDYLVVLLAVALIGGAGAGCYNPSILNDGFVCAEAGKACPDGFQCNPTTHTCHAVEKCSVPAPTPLCADEAKAGTACNPACQTGCACGRCNVAGKLAVCSMVIGPAKLGELCTPKNDNCAAGLICLLEPDTCGTDIGRCYQHCTTTGSTAAQCPAGRACEIPILDTNGVDTTYRACGLATTPCNPVAASNNGCPSAAFGCYLSIASGSTLCDCPNHTPSVILGGVCSAYNDCAAGLVCTTSAGSVGPHCRQICSPAANPTGCPTGQRCIAIGTMYGYCQAG